MDGALVFFVFAVAFGVAGDSRAEIRQRRPRCTAEPVEPLDGEAFKIEFKPQDATAGLRNNFVLMSTSRTFEP